MSGLGCPYRKLYLALTFLCIQFWLANTFCSLSRLLNLHAWKHGSTVQIWHMISSTIFGSIFWEHPSPRESCTLYGWWPTLGLPHWAWCQYMVGHVTYRCLHLSCTLYVHVYKLIWYGVLFSFYCQEQGYIQALLLGVQSAGYYICQDLIWPFKGSWMILSSCYNY